jgi:predicted double-glycine peptidase
MRFKYHRQKTDFSCGPACMKMALESLGIKFSERTLMKLMKTEPKKGTKNKVFPALAAKLGLDCFVKEKSSIPELIKKTGEGYRIIVGVYIKEEKLGHYAVLKKIDAKKVHLLDPYFGPNVSYSYAAFLKMWRNSPKEDNKKRWFAGIRKRQNKK